MHRKLRLKRITAVAILCAFLSASFSTPTLAQDVFLPAPGVRLSLTSDPLAPMMLGITINPADPLKFDFLMDKGAGQLSSDEQSTQYQRLIKYFLAGLTVPEKDLWVNLSPYEGSRIVAPAFGETEMGRDLLAQDYVLKQITASLIYPEDELGKKFWADVYKKAHDQFGTTNIPVNTFNKVWILPDQAEVYEQGTSAYVIKSHLKVMLDEDYLAFAKNQSPTRGQVPFGMATATETENLSSSTLPTPQPLNAKAKTLASQVVREIILPALEKEVNEGKNFVQLRQINNALILATWYKMAIKESLLGGFYVDQNKVKGVDHEDKQANEKIYKQYIAAFRKGVYSFIKEEHDPYTKELIPRKYFSGGFQGQYRKMSRKSDQESLAMLGDVLKGRASRLVNVKAGAEDSAMNVDDPAGPNYLPFWTVMESYGFITKEKLAEKKRLSTYDGEKSTREAHSRPLNPAPSKPSTTPDTKNQAMVTTFRTRVNNSYEFVTNGKRYKVVTDANELASLKAFLDELKDIIGKLIRAMDSIGYADNRPVATDEQIEEIQRLIISVRDLFERSEKQSHPLINKLVLTLSHSFTVRKPADIEGTPEEASDLLNSHWNLIALLTTLTGYAPKINTLSTQDFINQIKNPQKDLKRIFNFIRHVSMTDQISIISVPIFTKSQFEEVIDPRPVNSFVIKGRPYIVYNTPALKSAVAELEQEMSLFISSISIVEREMDRTGIYLKNEARKAEALFHVFEQHRRKIDGTFVKSYLRDFKPVDVAAILNSLIKLGYLDFRYKVTDKFNGSLGQDFKESFGFKDDQFSTIEKALIEAKSIGDDPMYKRFSRTINRRFFDAGQDYITDWDIPNVTTPMVMAFQMLDFGFDPSSYEQLGLVVAAIRSRFLPFFQYVKTFDILEGMDALDELADSSRNESTEPILNPLGLYVVESSTVIAQTESNLAMNTPNPNRLGGIDLTREESTLSIKRDGKGVALGLQMQDAGALRKIEGLTPVIINITPVSPSAVLSTLTAVGRNAIVN